MQKIRAYVYVHMHLLTQSNRQTDGRGLKRYKRIKEKINYPLGNKDKEKCLCMCHNHPGTERTSVTVHMNKHLQANHNEIFTYKMFALYFSV